MSDEWSIDIGGYGKTKEELRLDELESRMVIYENLIGLVKAQDEYIKLISDEAGECASIAAVHGWTTTRFEQGQSLRAKIEKLKKDAAI